MLEVNALSNRGIGLAIEVHRTVGPGLLENVYQECLCIELEEAGIAFQSQVMGPGPLQSALDPHGVPLGYCCGGCHHIGNQGGSRHRPSP